MCKRCIILTYDEVLDIVLKLEVGAPLNFNPDWPIRTTEAYPKSVAPLIVPAFDTGTPSPYSFLNARDSCNNGFCSNFWSSYPSNIYFGSRIIQHVAPRLRARITGSTGAFVGIRGYLETRSRV